MEFRDLHANGDKPVDCAHGGSGSVGSALGRVLGKRDRSEDWRSFARDIGVDARWAAEQIQRFAANTPACLQAEIDALSPDNRSSGITTRLLAAITQRCDSITA
ncbi:hypothetical protein [Candidatus Poriferisodalis sp.]|uniref:hypothetical protein n=1 Tax=Candidatus Poriferisodalis sp. TaxID=3101277 RepID=UPI003AF98052